VRADVFFPNIKRWRVPKKALESQGIKYTLTFNSLSEFTNGKHFLPDLVRIYMDLNTPIKLTVDDFKDYLSLVRKLYALTSDFIKYYDDKIKQSHQKYLSELQVDIRNMVLGGLKPDCEYTEKAYGLLAEDFLGLSLEDRKLCVKPGARVIVKETKFVEFVRLLNQLSKFIIDEAMKNLNLSNNASQENNASQQNIEDLITEIIKTSYDLSVGVNAFATSVFGLRKITPEYRKKAYENVPDELLKVLGFSTLMNVKGFEIKGFPDYFTKFVFGETPEFSDYVSIYRYYHSINGIYTNTIQPKTLGGAICVLNEIIWRYIDLLYEKLSRWYEGIVNIREEYIKEAWRSLDEFGWRMPDYLMTFTIDFKKVLEGINPSLLQLLGYDNSSTITEYFTWEWNCHQYGIHSDCRYELKEYKLSRSIPLSELFVDIMPAIFLGVIDTTLDFHYVFDRKALLIVIRTSPRS